MEDTPMFLQGPSRVGMPQSSRWVYHIVEKAGIGMVLLCLFVQLSKTI